MVDRSSLRARHMYIFTHSLRVRKMKLFVRTHTFTLYLQCFGVREICAYARLLSFYLLTLAYAKPHSVCVRLLFCDYFLYLCVRNLRVCRLILTVRTHLRVRTIRTDR